MMKKIFLLIIGIVSLGMLAKAQDTTHIQPDVSSFSRAAGNPVTVMTEAAGNWIATVDSTDATIRWEKTNYPMVYGADATEQNEYFVVNNGISFKLDSTASTIINTGNLDSAYRVTFDYFCNVNTLAGNAELRYGFTIGGSIDDVNSFVGTVDLTNAGNVGAWQSITITDAQINAFIENNLTAEAQTEKLVFWYLADATADSINLAIDNVLVDSTQTAWVTETNKVDEDFEGTYTQPALTTAGWVDFNHARIVEDDTYNQREWLTSPQVYLPKVAYTSYELDMEYYILNSDVDQPEDAKALYIITATDTVLLYDFTGESGVLSIDEADILGQTGISLGTYADSTVSFGILYEHIFDGTIDDDFYFTSFMVHQEFDETQVQADAQVALGNFDELVNPSDIYDDFLTPNTGRAEGFWAVPPLNWDITETSNTTWERASTSGHDYNAYIDTAGAIGVAMNETLASETFAIDYPSTTADYVMSFQWLTETHYNAGTNIDPIFKDEAGINSDFADIIVEVRTNGGAWTQVWQEDDEDLLNATTVGNWTDYQTYMSDNGTAGWYTTELNLTELGIVTSSTTSIEVRVNYSGDGVNSGWFAFDNLYIKQTQLPDYSAEAVQPFTLDKVNMTAERYLVIPERQLQNPYLPGLFLTNNGVTSAQTERIFAYITVDGGAEEVIGYTDYLPIGAGTTYVEIDNLQTKYEDDSLIFEIGHNYLIRFEGSANITDENGPIDVQTKFRIEELKLSKCGPNNLTGGYVHNESKGIGSIYQIWEDEVITSIDVYSHGGFAGTGPEFNMQIIKVAAPGATTGEVVYTSPVKNMVIGKNTFSFSDTEDKELELEAGYYIFMYNQLSDESLNLKLDALGSVYRQDVDGNIYTSDVEGLDLNGVSVVDNGDIRMDIFLRQNTAPEFETAEPVKTLTAVAGKEFTFVVEGSDVDGDSLVWTYNDLPAWLNAWVDVDTAKTTITFTGTPTVDDLGTFSYAIDLEDELGLSASNYPVNDGTWDVTIKVVSQIATFAAPYDYDFLGTTLDVNWTKIQDVDETGATTTWGISNDATIGGEAKAQNEWLISAPIYLPVAEMGYDINYTLAFDWWVTDDGNGGTNNVNNFIGGTDVLGSGEDQDGNFADVTVWISTDNGETWGTKIWKEDDPDLVAASTEGIFSDERWGYVEKTAGTAYTSEFDLEAFIGDTILVAFQYESKNGDIGAVEFNIDNFEVTTNDEVDIEVVAYTENPSIPQRLVDATNGHDIEFHFVNDGQMVSEDAMFTINVPKLGFYEENTLVAGDFTDGVYVYTVNIPATMELTTYTATCVFTCEGNTAGASITRNKTLTVGTTLLNNEFVTGLDREVAGWHDGLGVIYNLTTAAELEKITFDANGANNDFAVTIIEIANENSTTGTVVARIDDDGGAVLQTINGSNEVVIADDDDFVDDNGDAIPFILEAGMYVIMIDPINETELDWGIDGSDLDYDLGHFVRGNATNLYMGAEDKDGALDIKLDFKANVAPEFYADEDGDLATDDNAYGFDNTNPDYDVFDYEYNVIEGYAATFEITVADDNALDALTLARVIEPTNELPWLTFDFATKTDTAIMTIANTAEVGMHTSWLWVYDGIDSAKFEITINILGEDDYIPVDADGNDFVETFDAANPITNADYEWDLDKAANSTEDALVWGYHNNAAFISTDDTEGEYQNELLVLSPKNLIYFSSPVADTTYWLDVDFTIEDIDNMTAAGPLGSGNDADGYNNADFRILISTDLGTTWTTLFQEDDQALVEAAGIDYPMEDDGAYKALIDVTAYAGEKVLVAFGWEAIAEDVNVANLWVNNVKISEKDPEVTLEIVDYNVMPAFIPVNQLTGFDVEMTVENNGTTASDTATIRAEVKFNGADLVPAYAERASMPSIAKNGSEDFAFADVTDIDYEFQGAFSINYFIDQPYDGTNANYTFNVSDYVYMYASGGQTWLNTEAEMGYGQVFTLNTADRLTHILADGGNDGDDVIIEIIQLATTDATTGTVVYKSSNLTRAQNYVNVGGNWMDAFVIEPQDLEPGIYAVLITDADGDALEILCQTNVNNNYTASYIKGTADEFEVVEENTYTYVGMYFESLDPKFVNADGSNLNISDKQAVVGVPFELSIRAIDPDVDDVPSILGETLPDWLTVTDNGDGFATLTGTPTIDNLGDNAVELHVTDGINFASDVFTVVVVGNPAPEFTQSPEITAVVGVEYTYSTTAVDPYGDVVTITVPVSPSWLTVDVVDNSVSLTGAPANENLGNNMVKILATDAFGKTTEQIFNIYVYDNEAPVFVSDPVTEIMVGNDYRYFVKTYDANDLDELTIVATTIPTWLTLETTSNGRATLYGTAPAEDGTHDVVITVTDEVGASATQTFTITVYGANNAPVFTSTEVTEATEDVIYRYDITATDADEDYLMFEGEVLPNWLVLTVTGYGEAHLQGVPTQGYVGDNTVVLSVYDGTDYDVQEFTIVVAEVNDAPQILSPVNDQAVSGQEYAYNVEGWDEEGAQLTFTADLPEWLTIVSAQDGTALVKGIPANENVGDVNISIQLSDGNSTVTQDFVLTVASAVGIGNSEDADVVLYPNPSNGLFNIANAEGATIYVYSTTGKVVKHIDSALALESVNINGFENGTYIVKIVSENNVITKSINIIK